MSDSTNKLEGVRSAWTAADEARLAELTERKARVMAEKRDRVMQVVVCMAGSHETPDSVCDAMIKSADELILALEPFSSLVVTKR